MIEAFFPRGIGESENGEFSVQKALEEISEISERLFELQQPITEDDKGLIATVSLAIKQIINFCLDKGAVVGSSENYGLQLEEVRRLEADFRHILDGLEITQDQISDYEKSVTPEITLTGFEEDEEEPAMPTPVVEPDQDDEVGNGTPLERLMDENEQKQGESFSDYFERGLRELSDFLSRLLHEIDQDWSGREVEALDQLNEAINIINTLQARINELRAEIAFIFDPQVLTQEAKTEFNNFINQLEDQIEGSLEEVKKLLQKFEPTQQLEDARKKNLLYELASDSYQDILPLETSAHTARGRTWTDADAPDLKAEILSLTDQVNNLRDRNVALEQQAFSAKFNTADIIQRIEKLEQKIVAVERIIDELRTKYDQLNIPPVTPGLAAQTEQEKQLDSEIELFKSALDEIRSVQSYVVDENIDPTVEAFRKPQSHLEQIKRLGIDLPRYEAFEYEFLLLKYTVLKDTIISNVERRETNDDSAEAIDHFQNSRLNSLKTELEATVRRIKQPKRQEFEKDMGGFMTQYETLLKTAMAVKSTRNNALGITGKATESSAMTLPTAEPVYWKDFTNEMMGLLMQPNALPPSEGEFRGLAEKEVNQIIGTREVDVFNPELGKNEVKNIDITAIGQCMRYLDLMFSGRIPSFEPNRRTIYGLSINTIFEEIQRLDNLRLNQEYLADVSRAGGGPSPDRNDEKYKSKITHLEARRAFYLAVSMYRHIGLAPSSFNQPSPAYYALNLDYAWKEIALNTGGLSALVAASLFGYSHEQLVTPDNPDGVLLLLEQLTPERVIKNLVFKILVGSTRVDKAREAIMKVFKDKKIPERFNFLFDLPLLPLVPTRTAPKYEDGKFVKEVYHYLTFLLPMQNMVVKDSAGRPYHCDDGSGNFRNDAKEYMSFEKMVDNKRRREMTSVADPEQFYKDWGYYPDPNGEIMWEALPFNDKKKEETMGFWVDQAKNIVNFYQEILFATTTELIGKTDKEISAAFNKKIKYAIELLNPYAHVIRYDKANADALELRSKMLQTVIFVQGMLMLLEGDKSLHEVEHIINRYTIEDEHAIEAIETALKAAFSTTVFTREFAQTLSNEIVKMLQYK